MYSSRLNKTISGFTLIEIMVVVGIIAVLATVVAVNAIESGKISRDAKRQSDLRALQSAIELYKNKHGRYPEGCRGANNWSGQIGTLYQCGDGTGRYIVGNESENRPFSEFAVTLPQDKKLNGDTSGYIYMTNVEGTVYKLKAHRTVESDVVDYLHEFKPCDIRVASNPANGNLSSGSSDREVIGWCGRVHPTNSLPSSCRSTNLDWSASYAVWGGFAQKLSGVDTGNSNTLIVRDTTNIICQ